MASRPSASAGRLWRLPLLNAALAATYVLLAWVATRSDPSNAILWPSSAIAVFGVWVLGFTAAPGILLGAYIANAEVIGWPAQTALLIAVGNTASVSFAWWVLRRIRQPWRGLQDTGDTLAFILTLGLLGPAISASVGVISSLLAAPPRLHDIGMLGPIWLISDACSVLVYAPMLVLWWERRHERLPRPTAEFVILPLIALVGVVVLAFSPPARQALPLGLASLALLPLLWGAMRLSMRLASLFMAVLFTLALVGAALGLGPMMVLPIDERASVLQLLGISLACTVLLASSLAQERSLALRQLREANAGLERAVERRTKAMVKSQRKLQEQLRFQDSLLGALPNPTAYSAANGRLELVNQAFTRLMERSRDALLGRRPAEVFEDSLLHTWTSMDRQLHVERRPLSQECRQVSSDGEATVWIVNKAQVTDPASQESLGIVTSLQDITQLKRLQEQLERDERGLRFLVEESPVPLVITRVHDSVQLFANRAADELFRADHTSRSGKLLRDLWVEPAQRRSVVEQVLREGVVRGLETQFLRYDGSPVWLLLSVTHTQYRGDEALVFAFKDITPTKEREHTLRALAYTDPLTGVANRRSFLARAAAALQEAKIQGKPLAVLALDIDHFKQINDVYGHPTGDRALRSFSQVCQQLARDDALLGRLGGDEFAIVLPRSDDGVAYDFAQRLRLAVQENATIEHAPLRLQLTTSIGIAHHPCEHLTECGLDDLLARADQALYRAKQRGRNRVELWTGHDQPGAA